MRRSTSSHLVSIISLTDNYPITYDTSYLPCALLSPPNKVPMSFWYQTPVKTTGLHQVNSFFRPSTTITCVSPKIQYLYVKKDNRPRSDERPVETRTIETSLCVVVKSEKNVEKEKRRAMNAVSETWWRDRSHLKEWETSVIERWIKQQLKRCQNLIKSSDKANGIPNATQQSTNPDAMHQSHQRLEWICILVGAANANRHILSMR